MFYVITLLHIVSISIALKVWYCDMLKIAENIVMPLLWPIEFCGVSVNMFCVSVKSWFKVHYTLAWCQWQLYMLFIEWINFEGVFNILK